MGLQPGTATHDEVALGILSDFDDTGMRHGGADVATGSEVGSEDLPVVGRALESEGQFRDQVDVVFTVADHVVLFSGGLGATGVGLVPDIHESQRQLDVFTVDIESELDSSGLFEVRGVGRSGFLEHDHVTLQIPVDLLVVREGHSHTKGVELEVSTYSQEVS